jgi:ribonucleoside-diphosphate reductase alpha chain
MTAQAYKVSVKLADKFGPYDEWDDHHLKIVNKHWDHNFVAWKANQSNYIGINAIYAAANDIYDGYLLAEYEQSFNPVEPRKLNYNLRFRNAQVTVIAPTGSIGLAMDCDTTGCEPELSLVKHKFMVGGGHIEYINSIVKEALVNLGSYNDKEIELIINHIKESGTIENSNILNSKHLPIFDCSFKPQNGVRFLSPEAHVKMLAAIQPHISGGLSKTVNLPNEATVEDIQKIYQLAYDLKVKCIAVYRDGCKMNQPLTNTVENKDFSSPLDDDILFTDVVRMAKPTIRKPFTIEPEEIEEERLLEYKKEADRMGPIYGDRKKLPDTRHSITHKCNIGGQGFYITIGLYEDGNPAEIFITCSRHGSFARGTLDALGTFLSFALQYGAPVEDIVRKLKDITFSPNGITTNKEIPMAKSILDYLGKFLENTFLYTETTIETEKPKDLGFATGVPPEPVKQTKQNNSTFYGEPCSKCGDLMFRDGRCFTCRSCGFSSGGCS